MPAVDQLLTRYQLYISQWLASSSVKRFITLVVLFLSLYYAYDRITRARRREQQRAQLLAAGGTPTRPATQPAGQANASTASSSSAPVQRLLTSLSASAPSKAVPLSPTAKYLAPSKPQRCVVLSVPRVVLDESDQPIARVVPLLRLLAQHTQLVLITQTEKPAREQSETCCHVS